MKILIIFLVLILFTVPLASTFDVPIVNDKSQKVPMNEWQVQIDSYANDGHCYCIIGEKINASDGIDSFDVPHPPFQPPGRAFIFIRQPSFQQPHNKLWYEFRHSTSDYRSWNLTTYYVPIDNEGANITITWNISQLVLSGYITMNLAYNSQIISMMCVDSFTFHSEPGITNMRIVCYRIFTH